MLALSFLFFFSYIFSNIPLVFFYLQQKSESMEKSFAEVYEGVWKVDPVLCGEENAAVVLVGV